MATASILLELPKHLEIISESKKNPRLILAAALIETELEVEDNWDGFAEDDRLRVAWFVWLLHCGTNHDGDCVKQCASCVLCQCLRGIKEANRLLQKNKEICPEKSDEELFDMVIGNCLKEKSNVELSKESDKLIKYTEKMLVFDHHILKSWRHGGGDELVLV